MSLLIGFNKEHLPAFGENWRRFLTVGIILFLLGLLAISASTATTLVSVIFIGFIIFISGVLIAFDAFSFWWKKWNGFFLHLLIAILYIAAGGMLIKNPIEGSISLTFILGIFYIITGIFRITFTPTVGAPQWGWAWFNGIITLLLGILIIMSWPSSGLFIIGIFVGIDLLFSGWAYIMAGIAGKKGLLK